jgi:4-amino-4-deoxy-L-arabinose transferase-like glycosyltransferase
LNLPESFRSRWGLAALALLLLVLWFGALETRGLFWPDEGRYAEIAREMLVSGDYVTPRLNGLKYFEKPPLQYWFSAIVFKAFGPDEWTARLWPAATGFILVALSAILWRRWRGPDVGLVAGAVLASACLVLMGSQILTLDIGLAFFHSVALLAFIGAHRPGADARTRGWAIALAWAAMACAVLAKGLVGIVLPGLALVVYAAIERDLSVLRSAFTLRGIALFFAITLPWFVLVQRANPEFFDFFFVQEHFRRYLEPGHHRPGAWWYFLPIAALGMLPWTGALPGALKDAWRAPRDGSLHVERLLLIFAVVVIVFFSASSSKLPLYVLPALPPLAWLIALASSERRARIALDAAIASMVTGVLLTVLATRLDTLAKLRELGAGLDDYPPFLVAAGGILVVSGVVAIVLRRRVGATARIVLVAIANVTALQLMLAGTHVFDAYFSAERAIDTFVGENEVFPREPPFYSVEMLDQSVAFYLGRSLTQVAHQGELTAGIAAEPDKYIETTDEFERRWRAQAEAYAVMSPETFRKFSAAGLPMTVMARDPRRIFVARGGWPRAGTPKP